tara:strand:+ start:772 stop:1068 length:297 start_codon:yes stop_codon:yes gene_type:complete
MDFYTELATYLFGKKGTEMNPNGQTIGATKGVLNDDNKQGKKYINSAPMVRLNSQIGEITGMPIRPPQYGMLANRLGKNREREMGLLRLNPNLRGLLR